LPADFCSFIRFASQRGQEKIAAQVESRLWGGWSL